MGSTFLHLLANLLMAWWEERFIFSVSNPFCDAIIWYGRYIDDHLLVWNQGVAPVQMFLEYLNSNCFNLQFTGQWDNTTIYFLDINLVGNLVSGKVDTNLSRKPTSGKPCFVQIAAISDTLYQWSPMVNM